MSSDRPNSGRKPVSEQQGVAEQRQFEITLGPVEHLLRLLEWIRSSLQPSNLLEQPERRKVLVKLGPKDRLHRAAV